MRKLLSALAFATIGTLAVQDPASAQWPASSSSWQGYNGTINDCVTRADNALHQVGLIQSVHDAGSGDDISVYGHLNKYPTEVRCIVSKNIVFFITIGPNLEQATKYREAVIAKF